jgi:hypothetical protein
MPSPELMELLKRLQGEAAQVFVDSGTEARSNREDADTDRCFQLGYEACEKVLADLDPGEPRDGFEDQRTVLAFLLGEHPAQRTIPEVAQALYASHPGDFKSDDAVEGAIGDLVGAGLLHCRGRPVLPTRAALHIADLGME